MAMPQSRQAKLAAALVQEGLKLLEGAARMTRSMELLR
jgi:hypothetical protein